MNIYGNDQNVILMLTLFFKNYRVQVKKGAL